MIADASGRAISFALAPGTAHECTGPLLLTLLSLVPAWIITRPIATPATPSRPAFRASAHVLRYPPERDKAPIRLSDIDLYVNHRPRRRPLGQGSERSHTVHDRGGKTASLLHRRALHRYHMDSKIG